MSHQRQQIREAVAALLVTAGTSAGARVFTTRMVPLKRTELPALAVYALSEEVEAASGQTAPRELTRRLQLAVEGIVRQNEDVDNALDALALEVERAMHADETFGGKCGDSLLSTTEIDVAEEGDRSVGLVRLTYAVTYYTYAPDAADVTTENLDTVDVRTSLEGAQATGDQAHDVVDVSEE